MQVLKQMFHFRTNVPFWYNITRNWEHWEGYVDRVQIIFEQTRATKWMMQILLMPDKNDKPKKYFKRW